MAPTKVRHLLGPHAPIVSPVRGPRAGTVAGQRQRRQARGGRPKTDRLEAVWLCKVAERQMLRPSFVPPADIRRLWDVTPPGGLRRGRAPNPTAEGQTAASMRYAGCDEAGPQPLSCAADASIGRASESHSGARRDAMIPGPTPGAREPQAESLSGRGEGLVPVCRGGEWAVAGVGPLAGGAERGEFFDEFAVPRPARQGPLVGLAGSEGRASEPRAPAARAGLLLRWR